MTITQTLWLVETSDVVYGVSVGIVVSVIIFIFRKVPGLLFSIIGGWFGRSVHGKWSTKFTKDEVFSINAKPIEDDLNKCTISKEVIKAFKAECVSLSENAAVRGKKDHEWEIIDGDKTYGVEKEDERLNIHSKDNFEELAEVRQVLSWVWGTIYYPAKGRIYKFRGSLRTNVLVATYELRGKASITVDRGAFTLALTPGGDKMEGTYAWMEADLYPPQGGSYKWERK